MSKFINRKNTIQFFGSLIVGIVLLFLLFQFVDLREALAQIQELSIWEFTWIIPLSIVTVVISSFRWYAILRSMTKRIPTSFFNLFLIYLAGFPLGYILPSFGLSSQLGRGYFSELSNIPRKLHISSLTLEYAIHGMVNIFSITIGFLFLLISGYELVGKYAWLFALIFAVVSATIFFFWKRIPKKFIAYKELIGNAFKRHPVWMSVATVSVFAGYGWAMTIIYVFSRFIELDIGFYGVFVYAVVGAFFLGIPSPFKLGTNEASGAFSFSLIGLSATTGVALSFVYRISELVIAILGSIVLVCLMLFRGRK